MFYPQEQKCSLGKYAEQLHVKQGRHFLPEPEPHGGRVGANDEGTQGHW